MHRNLLLAVGWLTATFVAVGVSWAGVRLVAAQVVEPLPVAIAEVTDEPSPESPASPAATPSPRSTPSPGAGTPTGGSGPSTAPPPPSAPTPDEPPPSPAATVGDDDGDPPAASGEIETRTYSLVGGTVTVEFSSTAVRVVQATPHSGFTREVDQEHATEVEVEFRSEDHRSRLDAWWDGGPRSEVDEDGEASDDD